MFEFRAVTVSVAAALLLAIASLHAAEYPEKPVTFIVPFPAGSATDTLARVVGQEVTNEVKQRVLVDPRGGGGGNIGALAAARAPADGYTVLIATNTTHAANQHLYKQLPYHPVKDFAPVSGLAQGYQIMVVNPRVPAQRVSEFIALAKKNPGKLTFGQGSSSARVAVELFQQMSGTKLLHVPYKGNPLAMQDLIGGHIDMMIVDMPTGLPQVQSGKVRALAVTSRSRSSLTPELPTIDEAGVKGYEATFWFGLLAPAGTPPAIRDALNKHLLEALADEETLKMTQSQGLSRLTSSPEEFAARMRADALKWKKALGAS